METLLVTEMLQKKVSKNIRKKEKKGHIRQAKKKPTIKALTERKIWVLFKNRSNLPPMNFRTFEALFLKSDFRSFLGIFSKS